VRSCVLSGKNLGTNQLVRVKKKGRVWNKHLLKNWRPLNKKVAKPQKSSRERSANWRATLATKRLSKVPWTLNFNT
jgi:hypothetical protein